MMLPSRYEDLDDAFRGRLDPNRPLLDKIQEAIKSMAISGGIRFLPVYGESGSGKSCASREIDKHLPATRVVLLTREQIENGEMLCESVLKEANADRSKHIIAIVDQFEEAVSGKEHIPTQFIEKLSIYDRARLRGVSAVFIWLTTDRSFQKKLEDATSRNRRLLLAEGFSISGPPKSDWKRIVQETFSFHNGEKPLADFAIVETDIDKAVAENESIGDTLESIGVRLGSNLPTLQDLSEYRVIMVWPVADGIRMQRVLQFTRPRDGYQLNWDAWLREMNEADRNKLPMREYNRARLYFDMRLVPLRVAELHKLCDNLDDENCKLGATYLDWFKNTHLFHIISGSWDTYDFSPVRERESERANAASEWYHTVTDKPTKVGRRVAKILRELGEAAVHEKDVVSVHSTVRADVFVEKSQRNPRKQILELKVFSSENTMPSSIKEQIRVTLRRHAQFGGFLKPT